MTDKPGQPAPNLQPLSAFPERFAPFLNLAEKMCEMSGDSPVRAQFRQILAELKESQGGLTNALDQMTQQGKARGEATAKRLTLVKERLAKKQAATQAALARQAARAARPAPAPEPPASEEARLGEQLRDSLLEEFGLTRPTRLVEVSTDSVREMNSEVWQEGRVSPNPARPSPPRPLPSRAPAPLPRPKPDPAGRPPPPAREIGEEDVSEMFGSDQDEND